MAGELSARGYLLDTHVWLWLITADEARFARGVLQKIRDAASQDAVLVSEMSVWEIGQMHAAGKLVLTPTLDDWLARAGKTPGVSYLPVDRESLLLSTRLPGKFHHDPVDRLLLATAALQSITLATGDTQLIEYGKKTPGFAVLDVTT
jgi:PIN domain nuclease of toxin-antitoxin system